MTQKNTNTANRYMDNNNNRGFWFRENARTRRMTVELTRNTDGSYFVHGAKAHYTQGQSKHTVTVNPRQLKKELRTAAVTPKALQTH
jgi:aromatic ring hydroxylase